MRKHICSSPSVLIRIIILRRVRVVRITIWIILTQHVQIRPIGCGTAACTTCIPSLAWRSFLILWWSILSRSLPKQPFSGWLFARFLLAVNFRRYGGQLAWLRFLVFGYLTVSVCLTAMFVRAYLRNS